MKVFAPSHGGVLLSMKRLKGILGWGQERPGLWRDLLTAWAKLGTGHDLSIVPVWGNVFITMVHRPKVTLVAALADQSAPPVVEASESEPVSA